MPARETWIWLFFGSLLRMISESVGLNEGFFMEHRLDSMENHGVFTATSQTASWGMKQFDWENSCHYSWKISNLDTRMALGKNDISPSPSSDQQNQCWIKGSQVCINHMAGQEFEHHKPIVYWLVVDLPLWKIWKSVGMIISSIWNNKIRVPNHQPVYHIVYHVPMKIAISSLEWRKTYRIF